jgi:hypothetical protein
VTLQITTTNINVTSVILMTLQPLHMVSHYSLGVFGQSWFAITTKIVDLDMKVTNPDVAISGKQKSDRAQQLSKCKQKYGQQRSM